MKKALTAAVLLNLALAIYLFVLPKQRGSDLLLPASAVAKMEALYETEIASDQVNPSPSKEAEPASERPVTSQTPPVIQSPNRSQQRPVLPLVFQEVDLTQLNLNPDQLEAIEDLRQRFLDEIGGLHQDPKDPRYRERWNQSQPQIDDDLRGMIGFAAFQNYQIEAATLAEKSR